MLVRHGRGIRIFDAFGCLVLTELTMRAIFTGKQYYALRLAAVGGLLVGRGSRDRKSGSPRNTHSWIFQLVFGH